MVVTSITESQERTYKPEPDAALAAKVEFSMPIRLEVIRAAIFLSRDSAPPLPMHAGGSGGGCFAVRASG